MVNFTKDRKQFVLVSPKVQSASHSRVNVDALLHTTADFQVTYRVADRIRIHLSLGSQFCSIGFYVIFFMSLPYVLNAITL